MLYLNSKKFKIINKCRIRYVKCINVSRKYTQKIIKPGDYLTVVNLKQKKTKFKLLNAFISQNAFNNFRKAGYYFKSDTTQLFLLQNEEKLFGKRLLHAISLTLPQIKILKPLRRRLKKL